MSVSDHSDDEIDINTSETSSGFQSVKDDFVKSDVAGSSVVSGQGDSEMTTSSYEMIKSNFDPESDGSTDGSVSTSELPDLVPIDQKDEPIDDPVDEIVDDTDAAWVDMLGSGRIHKKILIKGSGEKVERGTLVKLRIKVPLNPLSLSFGSSECESTVHSEYDVLLGDGLDAPAAIELAAYEINVGGEVAIRSHKDLRGDLPDAFSVELLAILKQNLLQLADKSKEEGNKWWKGSEYKKAILFYQRGIRLIQQHHTESEESELSRDLWMKIMKNIGRCHFKLKENGKSLEKFNEILAADSKNLSVLDLKGDVLLRNKNYSELHKLCDQALKLKSDITDVMREKMTKRIETCLKEKAKQDEKHKAMCARMFKPLSNTPPKPDEPDEVEKVEETNFSRNVVLGAVIAAALAVGLWQAKKYL